MIFADHLVLDAPTRATTSAGFMKVRAKAARVGHYEYTGRDVDPDNKYGLRDTAIVKVAREPADVFDAASAHSFIGKPITDDHPSEAVTSTNWRDHARGTVMGAKWEEGGYLSFDLMLTDATAISKVDAGKRELSNGYSCDLVHGDFVASDGVACQFKQTNIRGNHVALVDRGRAGPDCRIADAATCDTAPRSIFDSLTNQEKPVPNIMTVDGYSVDIANADTAKATITTLLAARDAATGKVTTLETAAVTDAATIVARDAEIVTLKADLAAAKPTLQQLRDAGKQFAIIEAKAKAAGVTVTDAMDEGAIMKAVVDKAMPGNTYTADHVAIAFDALTKDTKVTDSQIVPLGPPATFSDAATDYTTDRNKRSRALSDAWRTPFNPAEAAA